MDLFDPGQLAGGNPTQVHDFNPGIIDSGPAKGLFWTMHIPTHDVHVDLEEATAAMRVSNADVEDYHTLKNALLDGPSDPASVSFVIRWQGVKARVEVPRLRAGVRGTVHRGLGHGHVVGERALDRVQLPLRPRRDLYDHLRRDRLGAKRRLLPRNRLVRQHPFGS